jgi:hypothetical protein
MDAHGSRAVGRDDGVQRHSARARRCCARASGFARRPATGGISVLPSVCSAPGAAPATAAAASSSPAAAAAIATALSPRALHTARGSCALSATIATARGSSHAPGAKP